jgi:hypothetical protein
MPSQLVSISEFLNLTLISEHDLLTMLERGELRTESTPLGELRIDISKLTPDQLATRPRHESADGAESESSLQEEIIASEVVAALDEMIDEALALAFRWTNEQAAGFKPDS